MKLEHLAILSNMDLNCFTNYSGKSAQRNNGCIFGSIQFSDTVKIVNEYDQEIPQSQTADNPV